MKFYIKLITLIIIAMNILCYSQFSGGSGTTEDPYQIATAEDLNNIRYYLTSSFIQTTDIDLGVAPWNVGEGWDPIGDYDWTDPSKSFRGSYDGNNYKISNLYVNSPALNDIGLFGCCQIALIQNLKLENINICGSSNTGGLVGYNTETFVSNCLVSGNIEGQSSVGLLIGYNYCDNIINNCISTGVVVGYLNNVGGLIGFNLFDNIVTNCGSEAEVTSFRDFTGGLIGQGNYNLKTENCYSEGIVISENGKLTGGLIGGSNDDGLIKNCFSKCKVINYNDSNGYIGGFIGGCGILDSCEILNCYSTGEVIGQNHLGGFIGFIEEGIIVSNSYWDMETSGIDSSAAGEGRTTAEMTLPYSGNTYVGWDFVNVWRDDTANQNSGYPTFQWVSGIEEDEDYIIPEISTLYQNYPNPFNPVTQIKFDLAKTGNVKLSVYNINGQKVAELANCVMYAGIHSVEFDGSNLNSGVYYYTLETYGKHLTRKMLLVK